jgi:hypothetical protein
VASRQAAGSFNPPLKVRIVCVFFIMFPPVHKARERQTGSDRGEELIRDGFAICSPARYVGGANERNRN